LHAIFYEFYTNGLEMTDFGRNMCHSKVHNVHYLRMEVFKSFLVTVGPVMGKCNGTHTETSQGRCKHQIVT